MKWTCIYVYQMVAHNMYLTALLTASDISIAKYVTYNV